MNLQISGEAANRIPEEVRARYPDADWRPVVALRNIIPHGYFTLNRRIMWETVQTDLPTLLRQIERILSVES